MLLSVGSDARDALPSILPNFPTVVNDHFKDLCDREQSIQGSMHQRRLNDALELHD